MPNVTAKYKKRTDPLLKGSLVEKAGLTEVVGVILEVFEGGERGLRSPYEIVFDADVLPGKEGVHRWPVNQTEALKLADAISPNTENWEGWAVRLVVHDVNNPDTGKMVAGLTVRSVLAPAEVKKKRKSKPKYKKEREVASARVDNESWPSDKDIPF